MSQRIAEVLGVEDIYTFAADPALARALFPNQVVRAHRFGLTKFARRHWQWMLPAMPYAWKRIDLRSYDVVITNSHSCTNAIRVGRSSYHISYCQTPMRYAWEWRREIGRFPAPIRPIWPLPAALLRRADKGWAQRVTLYIANSENVRNRIRRYYGRNSVVIYPAIDTTYWTPDDVGREDFFLVAGRMVAYKRPDIAVDAATKSGIKLVVAGGGPELDELKRRAGPSVEFVHNPTNEELRSLYRRAKAFLFPGIEDFGITLVEAQACGTPVVAYDAGGARETVKNGVTGLLYPDPTPGALARVLEDFDPTRYRTEDLRSHVRTFDVEQFDRAIRRVVVATLGVSVGVAATDDFAERLQQDLDVERE